MSDCVARTDFPSGLPSSANADPYFQKKKKGAKVCTGRDNRTKQKEVTATVLGYKMLMLIVILTLAES